MLNLINKKIDLNNLVCLKEFDFNQNNLDADFIIKGGTWFLENGWLTGKNPFNNPGMIISKEDFFGDVMLDFKARTVLPSTHDIDVMWNGSWNEDTNTRDVAYVAGLEGWWHGKVGFEKSPDYTLNVATQLFKFVPGTTYHVQAGSVEGHCFVLIDGQLALEITDPSPIDNTKCGKIGFEAYCSHIQFRDVLVKRLVYQKDNAAYTPEFPF